jgi:hypothetical protein
MHSKHIGILHGGIGTLIGMHAPIHAPAGAVATCNRQLADMAISIVI